MGKPKQFTKPPPSQKHKGKSKAPDPVTAEDFQLAADAEEETGGKHRAGDPAKSARAFQRALDLYTRGLTAHPKDFDLAYNKARLELEVSQHPSVLERTDVEPEEWLARTWESHKVAMGLDGSNLDVRFNASQVLMSLGEAGEGEKAVGWLGEAVGLLEGVLMGQEKALMDARRIEGEGESQEDQEMEDDGGVRLDGSSSNRAANSATTEQSATVISPTTPTDLLDTVHATLSALTTLVAMVDASALPQLSSTAQTLTESKASSYITLLPAEEQEKPRFATALARASFVAAFADAQYTSHLIELSEYIERLQAFSVPGQESDAGALVAEAQARSELVLSAIEQSEQSDTAFAAKECWQQLSQAQEGLTKAAKLDSDEGKQHRAKIYVSKGDAELLRWRLATTPDIDLSDGVKRSSGTLLTNAKTFYKGAEQHAKLFGDGDVVEKGRVRAAFVGELARLSAQDAGSSSGARSAAAASGPPMPVEDLMEVLEECVEEGLVDGRIAEQIMEKALGA